jgi:ribosomal protein S24E
VIELIHPEKSNVSKSDIKAKLAQTLKAKEENISIFGLKSKFGGGRSTGFALIYDTLDARKKFDSKKMLRKVSAKHCERRSLTLYYIGRLPREGQVWPQAEKGNQGQSQEGQRYRQG